MLYNFFKSNGHLGSAFVNTEGQSSSDLGSCGLAHL